MRCSASAMFASSNVDSCQARIRQSIYVTAHAKMSDLSANFIPSYEP